MEKKLNMSTGRKLEKLGKIYFNSFVVLPLT